MSRFLREAAAILTGLAFGLTAAHGVKAQSLNVDVDIDFPSIVILYCYDTVEVNFTATSLLTTLGVSSTTEGTATQTVAATETSPVGGLTTGTALNTLSPAAVTGFNSVPMDLNGVCAVRAVGTGGDVQVDLALTANTTLINGTSEIEVTGITGRDGGTSAGSSSGAFSGATFALATSGFATPQFIDVQLDLDLTNTTAAGVHSSASDDTFTVTITDP